MVRLFLGIPFGRTLSIASIPGTMNFDRREPRLVVKKAVGPDEIKNVVPRLYGSGPAG